jgi:hypothetical protein
LISALKLNYVEPLSSFAFKFNLHHYTLGGASGGAGGRKSRAGALAAEDDDDDEGFSAASPLPPWDVSDSVDGWISSPR